MKYLCLLILVSCGSAMQKNEAPAVSNAGFSDSLSVALDSLKESLSDLSDVADFAQNAQAKIDKLSKEKESLIKQLSDEDQPRYMMALSNPQYLDSSKSFDYNKKIADLEREVAYLKRRIYNDSSYIVRMNKSDKVAEYKPETPNESSLIVQPVPSNNIDVYIIPYSKKAKKNLMVYEAACNVSLINKFGGKLSSTYKGQHFFNDLPEGKYIVKFCTYFGNYQVIERTSEKQIITLVTSPPIK